MSNETHSPTQPFNSYPPMPPQAPVKKPSGFKRFVLPFVLLLLGLIIGGAAGASQVPDPVVHVQEKIVEKRVEVPTTPKSCLTALLHGEEVMQSSGRAIGVMSDMFKAAARLNADEITRLSPKIDAETVILEGIKPKYQSARDACQASR